MSFGRLKVISLSHKVRSAYWTCKCSCGKELVVSSVLLIHGKSKSCGCLGAEIRRRAKRHGELIGRHSSKEYIVWCNIQGRCSNPKNTSYDRYGERGIKVCQRWRESFENFLQDMGRAPSPQHSIDRVDNSKDYDPTNCKWSTRLEQANNRRSNVVINYNGERKTLKQWCLQLGIKYSDARKRIQDLKWPPEKAFTA